MDSEEFAVFIAHLRAESFSSDRLSLVRTVAADNYFTTAQVATVIREMSFSSDRVDCAVLLYPRVVDQSDFYRTYSAFTFDSSKREVQARLGI